MERPAPHLLRRLWQQVHRGAPCWRRHGADHWQGMRLTVSPGVVRQASQRLEALAVQLEVPPTQLAELVEPPAEVGGAVGVTIESSQGGKRQRGGTG
jgi:hypothetical protein